MVEPVSLSAPVTVQVREYIDPAIGVATPVSTLTVMGGSEKSRKVGVNLFAKCHLLLTLYKDDL